MQPTENQLRSKIVLMGRRLYEKDYVSATAGNISVRLPSGLFLTTPSNMSKADLKEEDIVTVTLEGKKRFGRRKPTSEFQMHRRIYEQRADVHAVVHAHPPTATGFACAGLALDQPINSEAVLALGRVPLTPYGTPGTREVPDSLMCCLDKNALLLANHGVVTYGKDLDEAYGFMEVVEHYAKICLVTRILGQQKTLSPDEVKKILGLRSAYFGAPNTPPD